LRGVCSQALPIVIDAKDDHLDREADDPGHAKVLDG
jgi:hypothetical protein